MHPLLALTLLSTTIFPLHNVQEAKVKLDVNGGRVEVKGGATELLELSSEDSPPPSIRQKGGKLSIESNSSVSDWKVGLNPILPTKLEIEGRAALLGVDLSDSSLNEVKIKSAGGKIDLSLSGAQPLLKEVDLKQRAGAIQTVLTGNYPRLEEIELESQVGDLALKLEGSFDELQEIDLKTVAGNLTIEIDGVAFGRTCELSATSSTGSFSILLPERVGVRAKVRTAAGQITAPGYRVEPAKEYSLYSFDPEGESNGRLYLRIESDTGNIQLQHAK